MGIIRNAGRTKRTPDIRAAVKTAMKAKGMSQRALAAKVGMRQPHLARWLSGGIGIHVDSAEVVMGALGLKIVGRK